MIRIAAFLFAGGDAFFGGLVLLALAAVAAFARGRRWSRPVVRIVSALGWIVLAASGTPLPWWFYSLGFAATVALLWPHGPGASADKPRRFVDLRVASSLAVFAWCLAGGAWEASYRLPPRFVRPAQRPAALVVIGDSVSAGLFGPHEYTWPKQFHDQHPVEVIDLSSEGATARSAIGQAERLNREHGDAAVVVLIEIGGNDYFEALPPAEFASNLDQLLTQLDRPQRQLAMLELPLPPFFNAYGRVQRELAARHRVPLISKREFARVVFAPGATLDTVHLSRVGHALMAEMVWSHLCPLLAK